MATARGFALLAVLALAGCGGLRDGPLNPAGWFGGGSAAPDPGSAAETRVGAAPGAEAVRDLRPRVGTLVDLEVSARPGGVIVLATGLAERQGYWGAELVARDEMRPVNGTLVFDFRVAPPPGPQPVGAEPPRLITAARDLSDQDLAGVSRIVVVSARGQRAAER